jgi:hypothetical protein
MLDGGGNPVDTLQVALEQRVSSIYLSFGKDLGKWVEHVRQYDQNRKQAHKTLIWIAVNSVAEAEVATNKWKADVLVVQGMHGLPEDAVALVYRERFSQTRDRSWRTRTRSSPTSHHPASTD